VKVELENLVTGEIVHFHAKDLRRAAAIQQKRYSDNWLITKVIEGNWSMDICKWWKHHFGIE